MIQGQDDDCWGIWTMEDGQLVEARLPRCTRWPLIDAHGDDVGQLICTRPFLDGQRADHVGVALLEDGWQLFVGSSAWSGGRSVIPIEVDVETEPDVVLALVEQQLVSRAFQGFDLDWRLDAETKSWSSRVTYRTYG